MPKAVFQDSAPVAAPKSYTLGYHPRRTDHPAILNASGAAVTTFHLGVTRAEIAGILAESGMTLRDDDSVALPAAPTDAPPATRRRVIAAMAAAAAGVATLATGAPPARAGLVAAGSAEAGQHPDAALLAALDAFDALEREMWPPGPGPATIALEEERDRRIAPLAARQHKVLATICTLRATTLEGCQARARSLFLWDKELPKALAAGDDPDGYHADRMFVALVRDLVTIGERAA